MAADPRSLRQHVVNAMRGRGRTSDRQFAREPSCQKFWLTDVTLIQSLSVRATRPAFCPLDPDDNFGGHYDRRTGAENFFLETFDSP